MRHLLMATVLVTAFGTAAGATDMYATAVGGYGALLGSYASPSGAKPDAKGGVTMLLQGLFGEEQLKYGAELGFMELYKKLDNRGRLVSDASLAVLPLQAVADYSFSDGPVAPFVSAGAGFYFPIEQGSPASDDRAIDAGSSSRAWPGGSLSAGVRMRAGKKLDVVLSTRYSLIDAGDRISTMGVYLGVGGWMPLAGEGEKHKVTFPLPEKNKRGTRKP